MNAVCHRCGAPKQGPFMPCKGCGYVPTGEARAVAWLFSLEYLDSFELDYARERILKGERPDVPKALRQHAREAMGAGPPEDARPLTPAQLGQLALLNVLFTPLAGIAVWFGLKQERPAASRQALRITLPVGAALGLLWVGMLVAART